MWLWQDGSKTEMTRLEGCVRGREGGRSPTGPAAGSGLGCHPSTSGQLESLYHLSHKQPALRRSLCGTLRMVSSGQRGAGGQTQLLQLPPRPPPRAPHLHQLICRGPERRCPCTCQHLKPKPATQPISAAPGKQSGKTDERGTGRFSSHSLD